MKRRSNEPFVFIASFLFTEDCARLHSCTQSSLYSYSFIYFFCCLFPVIHLDNVLEATIDDGFGDVLPQDVWR